jgi:hypothetical protein
MKTLRLLLLGMLFSTIVFAQSSSDLPSSHDITMLAGADYQILFQHKDVVGAPVDLTGAFLYAQFRSAPYPGGVLFANYSTFISGDPISGHSIMRLSRFQTRALSGKSGVWDLLMVDGQGFATYLLSGKGSVKPTATVWP